MRDQITIWIDPDFREFHNVARSTVEQLVEIAGWKTSFVSEVEAADFVYLSKPDPHSFLKSAGRDGWKNRSNCRPKLIDRTHIPSNAIIPDTSEVDIVLAANTLLSGFPERYPNIAQYAGRKIEDHGVPGPDISEWNLLDIPLVNEFAENIKNLVEQNTSVIPAKPRWPKGKCFALCVTHDCDRIQRFRTASFFRDGYVATCALDPKSAALNFGKGTFAFASKLKKSGPDPYINSWKNWIAFERENEIRSTNFIASWNKYSANASQLDVPYRINDPDLKNAVLELVNQGSEIGLHNSVNAWSEDRYDAECDLLERMLGLYPSVYRGHCWSLDSTNPERTMRRVAATTNMTMSSCLGMNLIHGYRRGLNYPYRPFDFESGDYCNSWEVPPVMMDQSLFLSGNTNEERVGAFRKRVNEVRHAKGCFVLDWHTDSLWQGFMAGMTKFVMKEISEIAADTNCWTASVGELVKWCREERWQT